MYANWTVEQLKAELRTRGGSLKGRKADLVCRLEFFDRNFNSGISQDLETDDVKMALPSSDSYHDINSSTTLPPLTRHHIQLYFDEHGKKTDEGLRLYESRFLVVVRAVSVGVFTFVKSICKASMKRVQYETNLKLHESGTVEETSCECVAGSGVAAHCKHVAMTLYGVEHMVREKIIVKYQTPTEMLQRFNAPRSVFTSTPLKASGLPMKRKLDSILFFPCTMKIVKIKYNEKFRSLISNFPLTTMPIKQLYRPANPYAVECDHDYSKISSAQKLLDSFHLNTISPDTVTEIEIETRGQTVNLKWLEYRDVRITASKFHTISSHHLRGVNQENFAKQMMCQRRFSSKATNHGIIHEKVALQRYMEATDLQVVQCGLFVSCERPYLAASPDGLLGEETVIEIKCPYTSRHQNITPITVPYLQENDNGELELKKTSPYYVQVQGQLYCTGRTYCNFIIYTFKDMKVIFINRDDEFIAQMTLKLEHFYQNYFKNALINKYLYRNYLEIINKTIQ